MKKAFKLIIAPVVAICFAGSLCLAACSGGGDDVEEVAEQTYRYEAEEAALWADESGLYDTLKKAEQGSYINDYVFTVQYDNTCSNNASVGYLAENNPTITFVINSDRAVSGAKLTMQAASMDLDSSSASSVYGLVSAKINSFKGADHDIMKVNGSSVALSGELPGADSVFADVLSFKLNIDNWGTLTATLDLVQGENTIVFTMEKSACLNFDYIEITAAANLTYDKTDNEEFNNGKGSDSGIEDEIITKDKSNENEATIVEKSAEDYTCSVTLEAEEAGLFDAEGKKDSSIGNLLKVEDATSRSGTDDDGETLSFDDGQSVGNFNTSGDKIVFCVYASDDVDDVLVTITGGSAMFGTSILYLADYVGSDHSSVLTVNGASAGLYGTIYASTASILKTGTYAASWGYLKAGISLSKGINYITFTCDGSGLNLDCIKLSFNSEIVTDDDEEATEADDDADEEAEVTYATTVESVSIASTTTTITSTTESNDDEEGTETLEAEKAYLINVTGKLDSKIGNLLKVETQSSRTGTGENDESLEFTDGESVGNFNTEGDMIVFAVYSDAEVDVNVKITGGTATFGSSVLYLADYVGSDHNILSVNGSSVALSGTISASSSSILKGAYEASWGYLTATITLNAGVNYIVFTCDGSGINLDCMELTWTRTVVSAEAEG